MRRDKRLRRAFPALSLLILASAIGLYLRSTDHMATIGYRNSVTKTEWSVAFLVPEDESFYWPAASAWATGRFAPGVVVFSRFHESYDDFVARSPGEGLMVGGCSGPLLTLLNDGPIPFSDVSTG